MNIAKIGLIERIFKPKKNFNIKQTSQITNNDQVSLSKLALRKSREGADERIKQIFENIPDVRLNKVKEVKEKLKDNSYLKNVNYDELAEKLLKPPFGVKIKSI